MFRKQDFKKIDLLGSGKISHTLIFIDREEEYQDLQGRAYTYWQDLCNQGSWGENTREAQWIQSSIHIS